jgi:hypothetical protein
MRIWTARRTRLLVLYWVSIWATAGILEIFGQACDAAQVAHSSSKPDTISIARREAVAALDAFIGPKS